GLFDDVVHGRVREAPQRSPVPAGIRAILMRGLSVKADDRYPSMNTLLGALADQLHRDPSEPPRPSSRRRFAAVLLAGGAMAAAAPLVTVRLAPQTSRSTRSIQRAPEPFASDLRNIPPRSTEPAVEPALPHPVTVASVLSAGPLGVRRSLERA